MSASVTAISISFKATAATKAEDDTPVAIRTDWSEEEEKKNCLDCCCSSSEGGWRYFVVIFIFLCFFFPDQILFCFPSIFQILFSQHLFLEFQLSADEFKANGKRL